MPYTIGPDGKPEFVEETPDRLAPAPAAAPAEGEPPPVIHSRESAIDTLKGIGSTVLGAALDAPLALGNLVDVATGGRGDASGRQFLENAVALAGGSNEKAAEYTEGQREWAKAHPYLHGASELAGQVLGGAALGGLASGAGEALGLGETATTGLRGAFEGALQNETSAREEAYIRNADLTGEQMLAAMGWGALVGGGTGLAVSKAGQMLFGRSGSRGATPFDSPRMAAGEDGALELGGEQNFHDTSVEPVVEPTEPAAAKPGFGERFASELRDFSEDRTAKAIGARGPEFRRLGVEKVRGIARDVLDGKLEDGTPIFKPLQSQAELTENLVRAKNEAGAALGDFREKIGNYIENEAPALRPKTAPIAERIEQEVIAPLEQSAIPQVAKKADDVRGIVDGLRGLGDDVSLDQLQKVRQELASIVYPKKVGAGLPPPPPASAAELQSAERIIEEEIEATTNRAAMKMGGDAVGNYGELKAKYASYKAAAQMASKQEAKTVGNRFFSPTDYLAGMAGAVHGGPMGVAAAVAHHAVREHGGAVLAVLADRLAQTVDRKIGAGIDGFFDRAIGLSTLPRVQVANDVTRAVARPSAARAASAVATPLALFMGKQKDKQAAYRERAQEVLDASANFGARIRDRSQETLGALPTKAPKLAAALVTTATRGAQFLSTKLPAPLINTQSFTPMSSRLPVSDVELNKFAAYWAAVSNPTSTIESFRRGTLTPEQVEATRAVYPELYQTIVEKVQTKLRALDAKGAFVPYTARLQLDLLLGLNGAGEPTASPEFVRTFQQIKAASDKAGGQEPGPTPPKRPINIANRLRSGTDALETGTKS